jgi:hypothetical protein
MNGFGVLVSRPADLQIPSDFQWHRDFEWKVTRHGA